MKYLNGLFDSLLRSRFFSVDGEGGGGEPAAPPPAAAPAAGPAGAAPVGAAPAVGAGTAPAPAAGPIVGADGKFTPDFSKAFPSLAPKFTSADALAKSYQNLEHMLGKQGKVAPLSKASSPEEVAAFRKALDVPDSPKGYEIPEIKEVGGKPLPAGVWDQARIDGYLAKFHELNVPKAAAAELVRFGIEQAAKNVVDISDLVAKQRDESLAKLKTDWGNSYDKNLETAQRGMRVTGLTQEQVEADPMLANNPTFIRAMLAVGALVQEGSAAGARGTTGQSISDPQTRINELQAIMSSPGYKKSSAYLSHDQNMAEMRMLIARKDQARG